MLGKKKPNISEEHSPAMLRNGSLRQCCSFVIVSAAVIAVIIVTFATCGSWPSGDGPSFFWVPSARQDVLNEGRTKVPWSPEDADHSQRGSDPKLLWSPDHNMAENDLYYVFPGDAVSAAVMYDHIQRRVPCSPHCLVSEHQVSALPSTAKLIVVLGDPVLRLYREQCHGPHACRQGELHAYVTQALEQAQNCISNVSAQLCATARSQAPEGPIYRGIYSLLIEDWLLRLSRARIYVIRLEDLIANATKELTTALTQLRLTGDKVSSKATSQTVYEARLQAVMADTELNPAYRLLPEDFLPQTRTALRDFYRPYNKLLSLILKDDRFQWTDVPGGLR